jgi:hypothetical protein
VIESRRKGLRLIGIINKQLPLEVAQPQLLLRFQLPYQVESLLGLGLFQLVPELE